jgi:putative CocE/NonD family hydrolase
VVREWYLVDGGAALDVVDGGSLDGRADAERTVISWEHDPANPVPSSTTADEVWTFLACYPDERELIKRQDVLSFTSEPVREPVDICGAARLRLRVATSGPSIHVFAKLLDVSPSGSVRAIVHGRMLFMDADLDRPVQLDFADVAYRLRTGHRLRLHISSSDHPIYVRHPGTQENPWFAERLAVNRQQLLVGGLDPARLELPVYEGDQRLPGAA